MKQTAVEWLVNCIESMDWGEIITRKELYAKAKQMEKEQIVEAVDCCVNSIQLSDDKNSFIVMSAEQYYHERFINKTI